MASTAKDIALIILVLGAIGSVLSPDGLLLLATAGCLAVIVVTMWGRDNIPVFLMPLAYQWTQVSIKPIETALLGVPLDSLSDFGVPLEPSAYLSLASLALLSCGLRYGIGPATPSTRAQFLTALQHWSTAQGTSVVLALMLAGYTLNTVAFILPPLRQPLLAFSSVKLIGLFLLTVWSIHTGRGRSLLLGAIAFEIVMGVTGFFAGFRESLFVIFLGVISMRPHLKPGALGLAGLVFALTATVAIFWTAVKPEYRKWVSEGGGQIVVKPLDERIAYIADAALAFDGAQFEKGFAALASRQSYIDFIAAVIQRVPEIIPHQDGRQLGDALYHVITPRALFPDKPPTPNDSDVTAYYTGLTTNNDRNASISIGYVGELYIDFGYAGALAAIALMGFAIGRAARAIAWRRGNGPIIAYGMLLAIALPLATFETALIKIVGSVATAILGAWAMATFARGTLIQRLIGRSRQVVRAVPGPR
jgi:hypothetical protein